ncbi:MAG: hypothetical protein NTX45_15705 [Proteobacteria bacterium]|nr:hypothetical protein [Pseudomonadota bacterium]
MSILSIELNDKTQQQLTVIAGIKAEPEVKLIRQAIQNYLEEELDALEDEAIWQEYNTTGGIEHERVMLWLEALARGENAKCPR